MSSAVICPGCKQRINISPQMMGQYVSCPMCKSQLAVPDSIVASTPPPSTPPQSTQPPIKPPDHLPPTTIDPPGNFPASSQRLRDQPPYSLDQPGSGSSLFWVLGMLGCGGLLALIIGLIAMAVLRGAPGL